MESVNFDRASTFYDATRGFPDGVAEQVGKFVAESAQLSTSDALLEIGIGTGRIALPLAPYVKFIAGADISIEMMKVLLSKRENKSVFPVLADGHALPYADNSFDAVTIVHVLHLVPDPVKILGDVKRVLKDNGKLLHSFNHKGDNSNPLVEAWSANRPKRKQGHNWESTSSALDQSGWELEQELSFTYNYEETVREFLHPLETRAWSSTWFVSDEELAIGVNAVKEAIGEHYNNDYDSVMSQQGSFAIQIMRAPA